MTILSAAASPSHLRLQGLPRIRSHLVLIWFLMAVQGLTRRLAWNGLQYAVDDALYSLGFAALWGVTTWIIFGLLDRHGMRPLTPRTLFPLAIFFVTTALVTTAANALLVKVLQPQLDLGRIFRMLVRMDFHLVLMWIVIIVGMGRVLQVWHEEQELRLRSVRNRTALVRATSAALGARFESHFLLNALNTASALTTTPAEAATVIRGIREILGAALQSDPADSVPLREEMHVVRQYAQLQETRYGDRLEVAIDMPEPVLDCTVPRFLVQPLVENAIKHGIEQLDEGDTVTVGGALEHDRLVITVTNPVPERAAFRMDNGFGLSGVRAKLELLFPKRYELSFDPSADGLSVTVRISMPAISS